MKTKSVGKLLTMFALEPADRVQLGKLADKYFQGNKSACVRELIRFGEEVIRKRYK